MKGDAGAMTCLERVRSIMRRHGPALDMARAARELGLSVRSLRRRLEEEGLSRTER
jgi:AraC-like DNA-binding protein